MLLRDEDLRTALGRISGWIDGHRVTGTGIGLSPDGSKHIEVFVRNLADDAKNAIQQQLSGYPIKFVESPTFKAL